MAGILHQDTGLVLCKRKVPNVQENIPGTKPGLMEEEISSISGAAW
ncbi:MAG: hypothetical protein MUP21_01835 [Dehalococcoidia bacterium]|nr:hypothetical protein [Dehalococcoidia bacterium]